VLIGLKRGGFEDALAAEQWVAGRAQRELLEALLRLQHVPLPDVERLVAEGADLLLQEVHGGHTLLRHIARDPAFLRLRQLAERGPDGPMTMSSFADIDEAERVVAQALADSAGPLRAWVEGAESDLRLDVPLRAAAGIVVDARGAVVLAQRAVVWLVRLRNGSIRLNTAYLDVDPE
jgi:hypothetical protein